jgi:hypothetical protein
MSTTTLVSLGVPKIGEEGLSPTPTPARNSLESTTRDMEKLPHEAEEQDSEDEPPQLSTLRMSLLVMGLTLSIFLVALDFVSYLIPNLY